MDGVTEFLNSAMASMDGYGQYLAIGLGAIWAIAVKFMSNEKAGKIRSKMIWVNDNILAKLPQVLTLVGKVLIKAGGLITSILKSDGVGGKK